MYNVKPKSSLLREPVTLYDSRASCPAAQKGTVIFMVKQVKISNFTEVKNIMNAASRCVNDIGVHDAKGSIADAKSILGLMSLDYTRPVLLVSENAEELETVYKAIN